MENNTIQCPYCLKESQKGVHVCTGCQATVLYGAPPGWCTFNSIQHLNIIIFDRYEFRNNGW